MKISITTKPPMANRLFLRFSLRAFLLLIVVLAAALGWAVHEARKQAVAVAELEKMGWSVDYSYNSAATFIENLRQWLGEEELRNVVVVSAHEGPLTTAAMAQLPVLTSLESLWLAEMPVGDAELIYLKGLTRMNYLSLSKTQVTDAGLRNLSGMRRLECLDLSGTAVTDAGLAHLHGLKRLERLDVSQTQVSDAGAQRLKKVLPDCEINR